MIKCFLTGLVDMQVNVTRLCSPVATFYDENDVIVEIANGGIVDIDIVNAKTDTQFFATLITGILAYANSSPRNYALTSDNIYFPYGGPNAQKRIQSSATHSIVTGTGAVGFQVSATRDAEVGYDATVVTTATIGGSQSGTLVLEIAPTNSATAGDWIEIARLTNGQSITLALALQSVQTIGGKLSGYVPAGYYAKIRSINNSGTPTYTYNSGQEILL